MRIFSQRSKQSCFTRFTCCTCKQWRARSQLKMTIDFALLAATDNEGFDQSSIISSPISTNSGLAWQLQNHRSSAQEKNINRQHLVGTLNRQFDSLMGQTFLAFLLFWSLPLSLLWKQFPLSACSSSIKLLRAPERSARFFLSQSTPVGRLAKVTVKGSPARA